MSCTVLAGGTTCSNTVAVAIAAGHYVIAQIDTTAAQTTWRVSFRF